MTATGALVEAAHRARVPVIWTAIVYTPAEAEGHTVTWLEKAPGMRALTEGSEAVRLDPRLPSRPEDPLIVKKGASAFFGTSLAASLTALGADTVLVCGATTSGCVRATAVDAVQSGYPVLVPRACVGDRARGPHDAALFDIQAKYGDVIGQDDALAYLRHPDRPPAPTDRRRSRAPRARTTAFPDPGRARRSRRTARHQPLGPLRSRRRCRRRGAPARPRLRRHRPAAAGPARHHLPRGHHGLRGPRADGPGAPPGAGRAGPRPVR
ncbi:isochorismatase family protein [Streptomyces albus]